MHPPDTKIILEVTWANPINRAEIIRKMILHCNFKMYFNNQCLYQKEVKIMLK